MKICLDHLTSANQMIMFCFNYMIQRIVVTDKAGKKSVVTDNLKGMLNTFLIDTLQVFGSNDWPISELILISFSRLAVFLKRFTLD